MPLHYAVLASVSGRYSPLEGRLLTCYSPVRHFMHFPKEVLIVRLACLRHAASVDSEPGSNSRWFPSSFYFVKIYLTYAIKREPDGLLCWINTWTRISSFQISTSVKASLTSRERNYRLYRSNLGCQAASQSWSTFFSKELNRNVRRQICILYTRLSYVKRHTKLLFKPSEFFANKSPSFPKLQGTLHFAFNSDRLNFGDLVKMAFLKVRLPSFFISNRSAFNFGDQFEMDRRSLALPTFVFGFSNCAQLG